MYNHQITLFQAHSEFYNHRNNFRRTIKRKTEQSSSSHQILSSLSHHTLTNTNNHHHQIMSHFGTGESYRRDVLETPQWEDIHGKTQNGGIRARSTDQRREKEAKQRGLGTQASRRERCSFLQGEDNCRR